MFNIIIRGGLKIPYISYSAEQKEYANSINLVDYLKKQGEQFKPAGKEFRWVSGHKSITINENKWYRHGTKEGGGPVSFLMGIYNMPYQDAMNALLKDSNILLSEQSKKKTEISSPKIEKEKEKFALPPKSSTMSHTYAYLAKTRGINTEIINEFVKQNKIYEYSFTPKDKPDKIYHNTVFVGYDEKDIAGYAHLKGTSTYGHKYAGDWSHSDKRYGFSFIGKSNNLFVFESAIDMLSYISLHQNNWKEHSYIALGGVSDNAMLQFLDTHSNIDTVTLCLDNDNKGIRNMATHLITLHQKGINVSFDVSNRKDWNEDLQNKTAKRDTKIFEGEPIIKIHNNTKIEVRRDTVYAFDNYEDLIYFMASKKYIESTIKDKISPSHYYWDKDTYFSFEGNYGNALAKYFLNNPHLKDIEFRTGLTALNIDAIDKYSEWMTKKGYGSEDTFKHLFGNWKHGFNTIMNFDTEKIKASFSPKTQTQEQVQKQTITM